MSGKKVSYYAVVMGDLVHSSHYDETIALHRLFNTAIDHQNTKSGDHLASPLTITLGDEFQGLAGSLADALRIAHSIRLDLLADDIECRFAIGVVELQTPVNTERAWNMMGAGLAQARRRLNEKQGNNLYRFALPGRSLIESLIEASGASMTAIERAWTPTQRRDIRALFDGATPADIAKRRNVSVHSVYKVRNAANFDLYLTIWNAMQNGLASLDEAYGLEGVPR